MSENANTLEKLVGLAREDTPEGRQKLLHEVTDLFMESPDSLNETEVSQFGQIMGHIVQEVEAQVRQQLSEKMASVDSAPRELICSLANDQIEVALPVLVNSGVLQDDDLVNIVKQHSQEHLKAISMRETVSETVTDALVEKGDDNVLEVLAGNDGARFSRGGMEVMVDRAEANESLNEAMMARKDVPDDLNGEMFWRVSWAMRERLLASDPNLDEAEIDALMEETRQWFASQQPEPDLTAAEKFIVRKEKLKQLDTGLLLNLMRQQKRAEFIVGMSHLSKIDTKTMRQTIDDISGERLVIVCRSLEMDPDVFWEILDLLDMDGRRTPDDVENLMGVYGRITPQAAQRALRFLRTRLSVQEKTAAG